MDQVRRTPIPERLREPLRHALRGERTEWPELDASEVDALIAHGVAPLVHAVTAHPQLRDEALRAAAGEPLRLADLREVLRSIDAILLKGTALGYDLYPDAELRPRSDVDLLIDPAHRNAIRSTFLAMGFTERVDSGDEHGLRQASFARTDAYGFEHVYDVHRAISNSALFANALRLHEIERVNLPRIGARAFGMKDAEALLLACVHRVAHHQDSQKLIWLIDIDRLRMRMTAEEHARFWRLARERGVVAVCAHSIATADEWLGREPKFMPGVIPIDEPTRAFLDRDARYGQRMLTELRALPWRARIERLRQLAFPPHEFMQTMFATRSRAALPWLYAYRGVRGVVRLFTRAATR
jgi:hypothetical protein